jgi:hypothetical protein
MASKCGWCPFLSNNGFGCDAPEPTCRSEGDLRSLQEDLKTVWEKEQHNWRGWQWAMAETLRLRAALGRCREMLLSADYSNSETVAVCEEALKNT